MYVELLKTKYKIKKLEKWKKGFFKYEKCMIDIGEKQVMCICRETPFALGMQITNVLCDEETKNEIYELYIKLYDDENRKGRKYIIFDILKVLSFVLIIGCLLWGFKNFMDGDYIISGLIHLIVVLMPFMPAALIKSFYIE